MALEIKNLNKSFRTGSTAQSVLRNVDLRIEPGEFVAVIGHSGCGKSTLLNLIAGLDTYDSGSIVLDGQPVAGPSHERAVVFQNFSLLPRMSLYDNVKVAAGAARRERPSADIATEAESQLRAMGLWDHRSKKPSQVSGGMKQRTALARAFAVQPRVLLLDEPFGALDALTRASLQDKLIELWSGESSTEIVLMVTHAVDEAVLLADRIVVLGNSSSSVAAVLEVDIPRPRDRRSLVEDPAYRRVTAALLDLLQAPHAA